METQDDRVQFQLRTLFSGIFGILGRITSTSKQRPHSRRSLTIEPLESRAVFAATVFPIIEFAGVPWSPPGLPTDYQYTGLPSSIKYTAEFKAQLKNVGKVLVKLLPAVGNIKPDSKPPKLSKESIELLKSNPELSRWQPLTPGEGFRNEALHAAHASVKPSFYSCSPRPR